MNTEGADEQATPIKLLILKTASGDWVIKKPSGQLISSGHRTRKEAQQEARRYLEDVGGGYIAIKDPH